MKESADRVVGILGSVNYTYVYSHGDIELYSLEPTLSKIKVFDSVYDLDLYCRINGIYNELKY